jgi:hypothetical protein
MICYCFDPKGMAPITLLELGLFAQSDKKIVVCCPDGYWRKGNVDILCSRLGIICSRRYSRPNHQIERVL